MSTRLCTAPSCGRPHHGRGLCSKHLKRLVARGVIAAPSFYDAIWSRIAVGGPDECWMSSGASARNYSHTHTVNATGGRVHVYLHRFVYEQFYGELRAGEVVRHSCDQPRCCNPAHLSAGTQADNIADMVARGRAGWQQGRPRQERCKRGHLYAECGYIDRRGRQICPPCRRLTARARSEAIEQGYSLPRVGRAA